MVKSVEYLTLSMFCFTCVIAILLIVACIVYYYQPFHVVGSMLVLLFLNLTYKFIVCMVCVSFLFFSIFLFSLFVFSVSQHTSQSGLYHGLSASIFKTVPKFIVAVTVIRSGVKSIASGVAGAVLTNPLDVIRNE